MTESALYQAIQGILTNVDLVEELRQKGLNRVRQFSWENTAWQTLEVYQEIFSQ